MILRLFSKKGPNLETIAGLYGAIVAQARHPAFYLDFAVPDTVDGRFEMVVLHLALFVRQARAHGGEARTLAQHVFDRFCQDMDHNMREMGVGDLAVPKRMRDVGEAFYGRATAYDAALDESNAARLATALARNIYSGMDDPTVATRLADYVMVAAQAVSFGTESAPIEASIRFPHPGTLSPSNPRAGTIP